MHHFRVLGLLDSLSSELEPARFRLLRIPERGWASGFTQSLDKEGDRNLLWGPGGEEHGADSNELGVRGLVDALVDGRDSGATCKPCEEGTEPWKTCGIPNFVCR